jgi:hypothetical protein
VRSERGGEVDRPGDHLEGTNLHPAAALVAGAVQHVHVVPGQRRAAVQERRLVGLDDKPVVRLLTGDQEGWGLRVSLEP